MNKSEPSFIQDWIDTNKTILKQMYPDIKDKDIDKFLEKEAKKFKNTECVLDNNYVDQTIKTDLASIYSWIKTEEPICGGYGVFYKNQNQVTSLLATICKKLIKSRKEYKSQLHKYDIGSYEYDTFDRLQISEKVTTNSIYGGCGMPASFLYNKYTAPSITSTGQSLISTSEQAFEAFLTNNSMFNNIDECIMFIFNVVQEKYKLPHSFIKDVDIDMVKKRLESTFYKYDDSYDDIIYSYLNNLSQMDLNKLYYKNNLYEFSSHKKILDLVENIIINSPEFKNPNKLPEKAKKHLEKLWDYYKEWVMYNHSPMNRIQRLKNDKRKCVVTIDTDSNMINLNPWVVFVHDNIISKNSDISCRDKNELKFIMINIMAYVATNMITDALAKYTSDSHVPEEYRSGINMKNEFLFSRIVLAEKKKRYVTSVRLREGDEIYPEKVDIKGFDFMKSTATEEIKNQFTRIINDRITQPDTVDIVGVLRDMNNLEKYVNDSLHNGEKRFLLPKSVKELGAYKAPLSEQGVRSVILWNYLYPDLEIDLPAKIDLVKLTLTSDEDLNKLKLQNREIYDRVEKLILNNQDPKISEKGLDILAIPKNLEQLPKWLIPFIDYDTIVYNTLSSFYPVLESIGLSTIKTSKKEYFSTIIDI